MNLSCGHTVQNQEECREIDIKAFGEEGREVHTISVCPECYVKYKSEGDILETWCDVLAWLDGEFVDDFHEAVEECIEDIENGKEPKFVRIS